MIRVLLIIMIMLLSLALGLQITRLSTKKTKNIVGTLSMYLGVTIIGLCGVYLYLSEWIFPGILSMGFVNVALVCALGLVIAGRFGVTSRVLYLCMISGFVVVLAVAALLVTWLPKYSYQQAQIVVQESLINKDKTITVTPLPEYPDLRMIHIKKNPIVSGEYALFFEVKNEIVSFRFDALSGEYEKR